MNYLRELTAKVRVLHGCKAVHVKSVPVTEISHGRVAWDGAVEVFDLTGHPNATRCYGWGYPGDAKRDGLDVVTVLEIPPVVSPETAVKVAIGSNGHAREPANGSGGGD